MEQQELLKILEEGRNLADLLRAYVAKLLLEVDEELAPASATSGILLGLSFIERTNALLRAEIKAQQE